MTYSIMLSLSLILSGMSVVRMNLQPSYSFLTILTVE